MTSPPSLFDVQLYETHTARGFHGGSVIAQGMSANRFQHTHVAIPELDDSTCMVIGKSLARWYDRNKRDLPWRRSKDPYAIWVSEVMLQQTQVQTVIPYYHRFLERFPDVVSLARSDLQSVLKVWEGLGYYSRARNLHKAAGMVAAEEKGRIPHAWESFRRLPGVGDYIAAAVLSIAFGQAHAVADGNVKRVIARLFMVDVPVNQASSHRVFNALAGRLLDERRPDRHNQAMMELGALTCTPRNPRCGDCPVSQFCQALHRDVVRFYPRRTQRQPLPVRKMVAGVVFKKGKVLLVQRPEQGLLGGLWEFPGGVLDAGVDPVEACAGQLEKIVNLQVAVSLHLGTVSHTYTHFRLQMDICLCRWRSGRVRLNGPVRFRWLSPARIGDLPLHGAVQKVLAMVQTLSVPE